jgi:hypothetical protein
MLGFYMLKWVVHTLAIVTNMFKLIIKHYLTEKHSSPLTKLLNESSVFKDNWHEYSGTS